MNVDFRCTIGLLIVECFLAGCGGSPLNGQVGTAGAKAPGLVAQQQKFCQIIQDGSNESGRLAAQANAETNPFRQDALQAQGYAAENKMFDDLYALLGPSGAFEGWRGRVGFRRPDDRGRINVGYSGCQFTKNGLYFSMSTGENNAIPLASPLGQAVAQLDPSKDVIISGAILLAPKGGGYWKFGMNYLDRHHFLPLEGEALPKLDQIGVSARFTSIAQAR
jgi:hypothetical protein